MALIGQIAIAATVQTQKLAQGLSRAGALLKGLERSVLGARAALGTLFAGAAAYGAARGLGKLVSGASDLGENMNKVQVIFGDGARSIVDASNEMAGAFGTSKNEFLDAAGKLGGLLKGAGFASGAVADLSVRMTKLAADSKSLFNTRDFNTAFDKIRSGLAGESEPLRDFGVFLTEDAVKARAMALGLARAGQEISQLAKVQARAALITEGLAAAQGDLARTAGGVANLTEGLKGRLANLGAQIGESLLPLTQSALGELNTAVGALSMAWEDNEGRVQAWGQASISAIHGTIGPLGVLQKSVGFIADAWQAVDRSFAALQSHTTSGIAWMVRNFPGFAEGINDIQRGAGGAQGRRRGLQEELVGGPGSGRRRAEEGLRVQAGRAGGLDGARRILRPGAGEGEVAPPRAGRGPQGHPGAGGRGQGEARRGQIRVGRGPQFGRGIQRHPQGPVRRRRRGQEAGRGHGPEHRPHQ